MGLKIFSNENGDNAPKKKSDGGGYADDQVGRFRSGYVDKSGKRDRPVGLSAFRVTTGDPEVADRIAELLVAPKGAAEWETAGEDNLELFTEASRVDILLEKATDLRQSMVMRTLKGVAYVSDGETISYPPERKGEPDPQAGDSFKARKAASKNGTGADPQIELYFRLADDPDLGLFKFQTGAWTMVSDLSYNETEEEIGEFFADAEPGDRLKATLSLEEVSFEAKTGDMAGQTVTFTKPVLELHGKA